jgi:hypothetical protein
LGLERIAAIEKMKILMPQVDIKAVVTRCHVHKEKMDISQSMIRNTHNVQE